MRMYVRLLNGEVKLSVVTPSGTFSQIRSLSPRQNATGMIPARVPLTWYVGRLAAGIVRVSVTRGRRSFQTIRALHPAKGTATGTMKRVA